MPHVEILIGKPPNLRGRKKASSDYGSEGYRFNSYWVRHFLGIEEPKKAPRRLRIDRALADYRMAGFASIRRGKPTKSGKRHLRTEQDAVPFLLGFFKTKQADELEPDLLDDFPMDDEPTASIQDAAQMSAAAAERRSDNNKPIVITNGLPECRRRFIWPHPMVLLSSTTT